MVDALREVKRSGRKLILVTGRELDDLCRVFPQFDLFDRIVWRTAQFFSRPDTKHERVLAQPPPQAMIDALRRRHVEPLSIGRSIVATWHPYETDVLEVIKELGLEYHVIFNKGAVMALPSSVNKATGLKAALQEIHLSPHNTVGVGDGENDHAFLSICECLVAVADALDSLKQRADLVTQRDHGAGVMELIEHLLENDLCDLDGRLSRHWIRLGQTDDGNEESVSPYGANVLIAGQSGGGKSSITSAILEHLSDDGYQFCLIDPEGDYEEFPCAVSLGDTDEAPTAREVIRLLDDPSDNASVNLLAIATDERPAFFGELMAGLQELREQSAHPHWIVLDEAHHLLPRERSAPPSVVNSVDKGLLFITVEPQHLPPSVTKEIDIILAVGESPDRTLDSFARGRGIEAPEAPPASLEKLHALLWRVGSSRPITTLRVDPPRWEGRRHRRKYAEGELAPEKSFYFRGPERKLNLRAHNLDTFMQTADGIDDDTWLYHLRQHSYSNWFREMIGDEDLAAKAAQIEGDHGLDPRQSRNRIREEIESRYTAPA